MNAARPSKPAGGSRRDRRRARTIANRSIAIMCSTQQRLARCSPRENANSASTPESGSPLRSNLAASRSGSAIALGAARDTSRAWPHLRTICSFSWTGKPTCGWNVSKLARARCAGPPRRFGRDSDAARNRTSYAPTISRLTAYRCCFSELLQSPRKKQPTNRKLHISQMRSRMSRGGCRQLREEDVAFL